MNKPIILIFISRYLPGYKSGGPLRTISNIVDFLGDEFEFKIVTRDRDVDDTQSYENILINQWQQVGKAQVYYLPPKQCNLAAFRKIIKNTAFDVLYLNSFFDFTFTFKPLMVRFLDKHFSKPVILAPRGEFSKGALGLKKIKKWVYITIASALNLYQDMVWHASSEQERDDIEYQSFIKPKGIYIAMDPPTRVADQSPHEALPLTASARLRMVFLSRISPMKNLEYALNVLRKVSVPVAFDIYGPAKEDDYWKKCQLLIRHMPPHVQVTYHGCVPHHEVGTIFSRYDLFFLPTRGENYGHVIAESLAMGTPVLISNRTPWQELAKEGLGWDLPLENEQAFVQCIESVALQSHQERTASRVHIKRMMLDKLTSAGVIEANRQLFRSQLSSNTLQGQGGGLQNLKKAYRYARIYDVKHALVKSLGRTRIPFRVSWLLAPFKWNKTKDIAVIGCGQFAFGIIAFFLTKHFGRRIGLCLDMNESALSTFAKCYAVPHQYSDFIDESNLAQIKLAYIASNHASHTDYAIYFLKRGIDVYIEKPISVSKQQLNDLKWAVQHSSADIYFGYNRPLSSAVKELVSKMNTSIFTLNCMVIGHFIHEGHWYRKPEEGTRVCGNLGHWIDLAVHLINARGGASRFDISIVYADSLAADDNLTVTMTSDRGDLITLTLTSREEPFEGIDETIVFQQKGLFVKIDDFRKATFQQGSRKTIKKYRPKDVGHERAVMQPWWGNKRDVDEVFLSTDLMLHIMDMVKNRDTFSVYRVCEETEKHRSPASRGLMSRNKDEHETDFAIT